MAKLAGIGLLLLWLLQGALCKEPSVSLPEFIDVLLGSCAFIPCSFETTAALGKDQIGVWISNDQWKGNKVFIKDTSYDVWANVSVTIGDVKEKDCSTRLDRAGHQQEGTYYFRTEGSYTYTFSQKGVTIRVRDRPVLSPAVPVTEGTVTSLSCSAPLSCPMDPPVLTWSDTLNGTTTEESREDNEIQVVTSVLRFTASRVHHDMRVNCTASSRGQHWTNTVTLNVTYAPKDAHILYDPDSWTLGMPASLTCTSSANPPSRYTWYEVTGPVVTYRGSGQTLTLLGEHGVYYCQAKNEVGAANSTTVTVDVLYSPSNTSIPGQRVRSTPEGGAVTLSCTSNAGPTRSYTWYQETGSSVTQRGSEQNLTLANVTISDGGLYYCEVKNKHGGQNSTAVTIKVQPPQSRPHPHLLGFYLVGALIPSFIFLLLLLLLFYTKRMKKMESHNEVNDLYCNREEVADHIYENVNTAGDFTVHEMGNVKSYI